MSAARLLNRRASCRWWPLALALAAGCGQSTTAPPTAADSASGDPAAQAADAHERAVEITDRMLRAYREADSYTDHAVYFEDAVFRGEGVAHETPYYEISVALDRPNQLRLSFAEALANDAGARRGFTIACDGELLRALVAEIPDQMVENPAPAKFTAANVLVDPAIELLLRNRTLGDLFPQLAMLLNDSDADEAAIFPLDSHPRLLDDAELDGRNCYRVGTTHPEGTRVLWIDAKTYALRRMELPVDAELARIDPENQFLRFTIRIDFRDVTFSAQIAPESFALEAPPGAHRVRRFVAPTAVEETATDASDEGEEDKTAKDADRED